MCDLNKPLVSCTLGDFIEAFSMMHKEEKTPTINVQPNLPKGMKGIMQIFNCTDYMARQIVKSGVIEAAIYRLGARTFVTDPCEAKRLYQLSQI